MKCLTNIPHFKRQINVSSSYKANHGSLTTAIPKPILLKSSLFRKHIKLKDTAKKTETGDKH